MARSKYNSLVKPRFNEIRGWLEEGATDKEVMEALKVGKSAFYQYMNKYPEFAKLMREARASKITELKNTLFKKAIGFQYTETEKITDKNGDVTIKEHTRTCLPSETAMLILLKHWDKDENGVAKWANDPATLQLKKEEFEFKKMNFESEQW